MLARDAQRPEPITAVDVPDVAAPTVGSLPVTSIESGQYTGTITWTPDHATFRNETAYTATITLEAKPGYTLHGVGVDAFTIEGATVTYDPDSGTIIATFPGTERTIDELRLAVVSPPITGRAPITTFETEQYTGSIEWSPSDAAFRIDTVYEATVSLEPATGYTVHGVAANRFTIANATVTHEANSGILHAIFEATTSSTDPPVDTPPESATDATIDLLAIPNVTAPVTGHTPVSSVDTTQYAGTIAWNPDDAPFQGNTAYTATLTLEPKTGYTLSNVDANTFTISGADTVTHDAHAGIVTATFATTDTTIDILTIPNVTPPAIGGIPVSSVDTDQYAGSITWSPAHDPFQDGTAYTATLTLTPKTGYTLAGVQENTFTLSDADTVTHDAHAGLVTATSPATDATIDLLAIPNVTAPVTGQTPASSVDTDQYAGSITWSPAHDPFQDGTAYTATLTLTPKTGYTLAGVQGNTFTVSDADTVTHDAESGDVAAEFPATDTTINLLALPDELTAAQVGATPMTSISTTEYTAEAQWTPNHATFRILTEYTADITVTPKSGYTLNGIDADSFTLVDANDVTHAADSGEISATFDATTLTFTSKAATGLDVGTKMVNSLFVSGSTVYIASSGGVYISTDGGDNFTKYTNGLGSISVANVFVEGNAIYAATAGGLSISTDGGANFTEDNGLGSYNVQDVFVEEGTIYAATYGGGISISTDGGDTFTSYTTGDGLPSNNALSVWVQDGTIYAGTFSGLAVASTTDPSNWENRTAGLERTHVADITVHEGSLYVATGSATTPYLSVSSDDGASYVNSEIPVGNYARTVFVHDGVIYVTTNGGLSVSSDGGTTFTTFTANGLPGTNLTGLYVDDDTVYVADVWNGLAAASY
ncbi:MAG: hypothetical protein RI554_05025 [Trueperaceae bacterium]|nr:hypothetical protein [Trueperaceae bacterium]